MRLMDKLTIPAFDSRWWVKLIYWITFKKWWVGKSINYEFDQAHYCGQYKNGDWYIVPSAKGYVVFTGMKPKE